MLAGAAAPLVTLLAFWITGGGLHHALTAGVWTAAGMLVLIEFVAARREHLSGAETSGQTLLGVGLALLVIALKAVLH
jgi:hypothetical protein